MARSVLLGRVGGDMTAFQIIMTYIGVWLFGYIMGKEGP